MWKTVKQIKVLKINWNKFLKFNHFQVMPTSKSVFRPSASASMSDENSDYDFDDDHNDHDDYNYD